jgi:glyoxylase-like metal-dependent hydrolase (beta-lactamase superfamily II)
MSKEQGAGFYRFKIGDFEAASISDGFLIFEEPKTLIAEGASDEEYTSFLESKFVSPKVGYFQINSLFIDTGKNKVLIDNGTGPYLGPSAGHVADHLRNLGVTPEEIDTVVISHAHLDHVFGTLTPDGEHVFPNARYVIGEEEWAFWTKPDVTVGLHVPDQMKELIISGAKRHLAGIKDRVEFVKPGQDVVTGITAIEAFGHSAGMLAINIASGSESLFYSADALHHFAISVEHPDWRIGADNDQAQGALTRKRVLDQVVAEKSLVLVPHFPFPGIGHVAAHGLSRKWEPTIWKWYV